MKKIYFDEVLWSVKDTAVIDGSIPLPSGADGSSVILDVCSAVRIDSAVSGKDEVKITGTARFTVLYSSEGMVPDSFDAECSFEHVSRIEGADPDMCIEALAQAVNVSCKNEGAFLRLGADIMVTYVGCKRKERQILCVHDDDDMQYDISSAPLYECSVKCVKNYLDTQFIVPQTMPEPEKLLYSYGYAMPENVVCESGRAAVEGELKLFVAYRSSDKNAPLQFISESVSFGEVISDESINEDSILSVNAAVERLSVRGEGDTVYVSAAISLCCLISNECKCEYISDMFSLTEHTVLKKDDICSCRISRCEPVKKVLRSDVMIPETCPEAARVLSVRTYAEIAGVVKQNDRLAVDGILYRKLCYTAAEGGIRSVLVKEPFDEEIPFLTDGDPIVDVHAEYTLASGSGRDIVLKTCLEFGISTKECLDFSAVTECEKNGKREPRNGIRVYYADGCETIFDIARKNCAKKSSVICLDNELDPPARGDRVLIM